jgi:hypothetical protein
MNPLAARLLTPECVGAIKLRRNAIEQLNDLLKGKVVVLD